MALDRVAKGRLATLIKFMAALPKKAEKHFHMQAWVMHNGEWNNVIGHHGIDAPEDVTKDKLIQCGMTACALGWGAMVPAFRRAGLALATRPYTDILEPVYEGKRDMSAATAFFRLSHNQASALFGSDNKDATPKAWASRAKKLIAHWDKKAA